MSFSSFGLHADLLRGIKDLAFTHPTPIQEKAIAPAIEGRDLLAVAQTGSGKTAAFMLPTIHRLITKPQHGPRAVRTLVLTPTRELAAQILDNTQALAVHTPVSAAAVIGGVSMNPQAHAFRAGTEILIATPGRLLDHLRYPYAKLDRLEVLILDEADRMMDMGFLPDIRRIMKYLPAKRQTLFFSATMPNEIRQLSMEMLHNPVSIHIEKQGPTAAGITQAVYPVPMHLKSALLVALLQDQTLDSVICFTRTKHRANRLAHFLTAKGITCAPIHGNRTQGQRIAALEGFKAGRFRVLVATDIAARGIDIADVSHVINFDCPHIPEDYIHRIGRTGRASATGDAFTFVSPDEEHDLRTIERVINKRLPRITLPDFDYSARPTEQLEIPIAQRIAEIRKRKAEERARRDAKLQRHHGGPVSNAPGQQQNRRDQNPRKPSLPGHGNSQFGGSGQRQGGGGATGGGGGGQKKRWHGKPKFRGGR